MNSRVIRFFLILFKWYRNLISKLFGERKPNHQNLLSGKSWESFCETLKSADAALVFPGAPQDPLNKAEGYRYLCRLVKTALEAFIEHADPRFPSLNRLIHETAKLGSDNPDNYYQNAVIDGQYEYRITGKRNNIHFLGFYTQKGGYGLSGNLEPTGALEGDDLQLDEDGSFEIKISQKKSGKNWLPVSENSNLLIVRQTYLDRENEIPAELEIDCLDKNADEFRILHPDTVQSGLERTGQFVAGASIFFAKWARDFQKHTNELPLFDPLKSLAAGGSEKITYFHSYWKIEPDQTLLVQFKPPECLHWNFQLNNHWMESLDYQRYRIHVNKHSAILNEDGSVVIAIAHTNPGVPNWIQTVGHKMGTMCLRFVESQWIPEIKTNLIRLDQVETGIKTLML